MNTTAKIVAIMPKSCFNEGLSLNIIELAITAVKICNPHIVGKYTVAGIIACAKTAHKLYIPRVKPIRINPTFILKSLLYKGSLVLLFSIGRISKHKTEENA